MVQKYFVIDNSNFQTIEEERAKNTLLLKNYFFRPRNTIARDKRYLSSKIGFLDFFLDINSL